MPTSQYIVYVFPTHISGCRRLFYQFCISKFWLKFTFTESQAFFDGKDLSLPTGSEIVPAQILKQLVESFGIVVSYKTLDENSDVTASDFLRGKIKQINNALKTHKVPCEIQSKKWNGYVIRHSRNRS